MNAVIFGAGAWGTALALHLDRVGHQVTLAPRRMEHALSLASTRRNEDYLPGFELSPSLQIGREVRPLVMEAEVVLLACPVAGLRRLCAEIGPHLSDAWQLRLVIALCKGLEQETQLFPSDVMREFFDPEMIAVLSGPSFAEEVARGKPTGVTLAAHPAAEDRITATQAAFSDDSFRIYRSTDLRGVEIGGCLKNVYAIAAGLCEGLALGANAKAALLTRAMREMTSVVGALGGEGSTAYGLSGFGDLVATCHGPLSRNRRFGVELAGGCSPEELLHSRKTVAEGAHAAIPFHSLARDKGLETPILDQVYAIVKGNTTPSRALKQLMSRDLKRE